jgi:hypothetical protein
VKDRAKRGRRVTIGQRAASDAARGDGEYIDPSPELPVFVAGFSAGMASTLLGALGYFGESYDSLMEYLVLGAGPALLYLSALRGWSNPKAGDVAPLWRLWLSGIAMLLVLAFAVGTVRLVGDLNDLRSFLADILMWSYFWSAILVGCRRANWLVIDRMLLVWFSIYSVVAVHQWLTSGLALEYMVRSRLTTSSTYFAWQGLFAWPYFVLTWGEGGLARKAVTAFGTATFVILAFLFGKRTDVGQVAFFALLVLFLHFRAQGRRPRLDTVRNAIITTAVFLATAFLAYRSLGVEEALPYAWERLKSRFLEAGTAVETVASNYRLVYETQAVVGEASSSELFLGRGLGGSIFTEAGRGGRTGVVHNGNMMLLLKGGILLLTVWTIGLGRMVWRCLRNRDPLLNRYHVPLTMMAVFSFAGFGNFVQGAPMFGFFMLCAGRCMARRDNIADYATTKTDGGVAPRTGCGRRSSFTCRQE